MFYQQLDIDLLRICFQRDGDIEHLVAENLAAYGRSALHIVG